MGLQSLTSSCRPAAVVLILYSITLLLTATNSLPYSHNTRQRRSMCLEKACTATHSNHPAICSIIHLNHMQGRTHVCTE